MKSSFWFKINVEVNVNLANVGNLVFMVSITTKHTNNGKTIGHINAKYEHESSNTSRSNLASNSCFVWAL
jgi:hypothetical protein